MDRNEKLLSPRELELLAGFNDELVSRPVPEGWTWDTDIKRYKKEISDTYRESDKRSRETNLFAKMYGFGPKLRHEDHDMYSELISPAEIKGPVVENPPPAMFSEYYGSYWDLVKTFQPGKAVLIVLTNGVVDREDRLVMGAGLAAEFKRRFANIDTLLGKLVRAANVPYYLQLAASSLSPPTNPTTFPIMSLPTKHHWKDPSDLDLIIRSIETVNSHVQHIIRRTNIICARPGCGLGGLDWKTVKAAILKSNICHQNWVFVSYPENGKSGWYPKLERTLPPTTRMFHPYTTRYFFSASGLATSTPISELTDLQLFYAIAMAKKRGSPSNELEELIDESNFRGFDHNRITKDSYIDVECNPHWEDPPVMPEF